MQKTGEPYEHRGNEEGKKSQYKEGGRDVAKEKKEVIEKGGKKGDFQEKRNYSKITEKKRRRIR